MYGMYNGNEIRRGPGQVWNNSEQSGSRSNAFMAILITTGEWRFARFSSLKFLTSHLPFSTKHSCVMLLRMIATRSVSSGFLVGFR